MKSRGKKKDVPQEARPMAEVFYEVATGHMLMMARAEKRARERLGIDPPQLKRKLVDRKSDGTFLFNGKPITNDHDTQYMRVFRAIYESAVSEGFASYVVINQRVELYGEKTVDDHREAVKRIQNGLKEFFAKTKIQPLLPSGEELISYKRGKGVIFRNPDIG